MQFTHILTVCAYAPQAAYYLGPAGVAGGPDWDLTSVLNLLQLLCLTDLGSYCMRAIRLLSTARYGLVCCLLRYSELDA